MNLIVGYQKLMTNKLIKSNQIFIDKQNIPYQVNIQLKLVCFLLFNSLVYILQIRTGDKSFAGIDANVQISIHGSKNQTRRLALTSAHVNLFEQNQLDTFVIVGSDLGDLLEIT